MTRVIVAGDLHMRDRAPANCTDAYLPDLYRMLRHVASLEAEIGADAVVWAGDVFDFKQPARTSHATVLKMIEVVQLYRNLWIVPGNHDLSNDVLASLHEKQPLGVLLAAGAHLLDGWHPNLPLYGVPWQQGWVSDERVPQEAFERWRSAGALDEGGVDPMIDLERALTVTHAPLFPPGTDVIYEHVDTAEIAAAMGHVGYLAYGHIHEYHGVYEDGGVTFSNLGALARGSLTDYNLSRDIRVAIWSDVADADYAVGFNEHVIPHAPASEIFRVVESSEAREKKVSLDRFLAEVGSATLEMSSTDAAIDHVRGMGLAPRIRDRAIEVLQETAP